MQAHEVADPADGDVELGGDVDLAPASSTDAIGPMGADVGEAELACAAFALIAEAGRSVIPMRRPWAWVRRRGSSARWKGRTGREMGSRALQADAVETWVCSYLSLALLIGVGAYAAFSWAWADPVGALLMLPVIVWQGWETLEEARNDESELDEPPDRALARQRAGGFT